MPVTELKLWTQKDVIVCIRMHFQRYMQSAPHLAKQKTGCWTLICTKKLNFKDNFMKKHRCTISERGRLASKTCGNKCG